MPLCILQYWLWTEHFNIQRHTSMNPTNVYINIVTSDVMSTHSHTHSLDVAMILHGSLWTVPSCILQSWLWTEHFNIQRHTSMTPTNVYINIVTTDVPCIQPHTHSLDVAIILNESLWTVPLCILQYWLLMWRKLLYVNILTSCTGYTFTLVVCLKYHILLKIFLQALL